MKKYNLEKDMSSDAEIISLLQDVDIAIQFYSALCNVDWIKINDIPEDEKIIDILKGINDDIWSCSWRYAAGIISRIRNENYNLKETYMDFYCAGREGIVSDIVKNKLEKLGWKPIIQDDHV